MKLPKVKRPELRKPKNKCWLNGDLRVMTFGLFMCAGLVMLYLTASQVCVYTTGSTLKEIVHQWETQ